MCPGIFKMCEREGESPEHENPFVFLDIIIGDIKAGRVVIELFKNVVPRAVENFRALCTGEFQNSTGRQLHYKRTYFHRVVPQFLVAGGDITDGDGTGGESIYGPEFEDENFIITHEQIGMVGMPNKGKPHTNNSQFYVTTVPCTHLDGTNVVFGQVRKGLKIFSEIQELNRKDDVPEVPCMIENCGEFRPGDRWNINTNDGTSDVYPPWPDDWDVMGTPEERNAKLEDAIVKIKESGNFFYNNHNYIDAEVKYKKTLRYINFLLATGKDYTGLQAVQNETKLHLNLAAVCLKRGKYYEVRDYCKKVLKMEPWNNKALYRRGQAYIELKDYDKALADLKQAYVACPNDKYILEQLQRVLALKSRYLCKEKVIFKKMLEGVSKRRRK